MFTIFLIIQKYSNILNSILINKQINIYIYLNILNLFKEISILDSEYFFLIHFHIL